MHSEVGKTERWRGVKSAIVVGLAGLTITLGVVRVLRVREHEIVAAEFELRAHEYVLAIQQEYDEGAVALRALAALFHAFTEVERNEFELFTTPLIESIGSISALGYDPIVPEAERAQFEAELEAAGFGDAGITERSEDAGELFRAPSRPDYVPVDMIAPIEGNKKAVGFNVASEPRRRMAADRARITHAVSATGPITLVQETGNQAGMLVFAPIYAKKVAESPVTGFAVGVFRVSQLVEGALANRASAGIDFDLIDESPGEKPVALYCSQGGITHGSASLPEKGVPIQTSHPMDIGGRTWMLHARPTDRFIQLHQTYAPLAALVVGVGLSLLGMLYLIWLGRLNQRVASSEAGFRQIADNIHEVFWIFNGKTLEPEYISPAFEEVYGRTRESLARLPNGLLDCVHPEDLDRVRNASQRLLAGKPIREEYRIVRDDNSVRWISDQRYPIRDGAPQGDRIVGVCSDITPQKVAELERDRLQQKAIQTQKLESMGTLAGGLAHQFNNLLTSIQGYAEMSVMNLPEGSPSHNDISKVMQSTEKAAELVAQMLASAGKGEYITEDIDLTRMVAGMHPMLSAVTSAPEFRLTCDLGEGLPSFRGDPERIRQIVMNLVTNAVEALPPEGGTVAIRTESIEAGRTYLQTTYLDETLSPGSYVYVEVEDTGSGMSQKMIQHIFDPFYTTKFTGRGLGMAAVLGIVRSQKGAIRIDSTPGAGTKVRVLFPAATNPAAP